MIRRRKLSEEVADELRRLLRAGTYPHGERLPSERELMQQFEVGRSAVREALTSLQRDGLVEIRSGERARVTSPSSRSMIDSLGGAVAHLLATPEGARNLQEARAIVEVALARHAARHATPDDLKALKVALRANRDATDDADAFENTDVIFHRRIWAVNRNPIFTGLSEGLDGWLHEQRAVTLRVAGQSRTAYLAHEEIYRAIAAQDQDRAERAMQAHLEQVARTYRTAVADRAGALPPS